MTIRCAGRRQELRIHSISKFAIEVCNVERIVEFVCREDFEERKDQHAVDHFVDSVVSSVGSSATGREISGGGRTCDRHWEKEG